MQPGELWSGFNVMTCRWLNVFVGYSLPVSLAFAPTSIIMHLLLSSSVVLLILPLFIWRSRSTKVNWSSIDGVHCFFSYRFADGCDHNLVESLFPLWKKDASRLLGADSLNAPRTFFRAVSSPDWFSLAITMAYMCLPSQVCYVVADSPPASPSVLDFYESDQPPGAYGICRIYCSPAKSMFYRACRLILWSFATKASSTRLRHQRWRLVSYNWWCLL